MVTKLPVVSGDVVTVLTVLTVGVVTVVGLSVIHMHKHAEYNIFHLAITAHASNLSISRQPTVLILIT